LAGKKGRGKENGGNKKLAVSLRQSTLTVQGGQGRNGESHKQVHNWSGSDRGRIGEPLARGRKEERVP